YVDVADLNSVVHRQRTLLAGVEARAIDVGAIGAVEVFDGQLVVLETDDGVLARAPDAVGRLLVFKVDVHRLFVGAANEVEALVNGIFDVALLAAHHQQARLSAGRQGDGRSGRGSGYGSGLRGRRDGFRNRGRGRLLGNRLRMVNGSGFQGDGGGYGNRLAHLRKSFQRRGVHRRNRDRLGNGDHRRRVGKG